MTQDNIPLALPDLLGNEEAYVCEAIKSTMISSSGRFVRQFEQDFSSLCGCNSAIGVSNGTVALHLALLGLNVGPGDEVIVPSLTYVATANAVKYVGAEPVFVDIDTDNWCIDPRRLALALTSRTKGIIAVHLYGHPADMDEINKFAEEHDLWVVEDAAEAHTALYKGRPVGGLGQAATFSFYGNKILTSGEGGAVTTSDRELESRMRLLGGQGMSLTQRYYFPVTGYNFRLSNIACAFLCAQLERADTIVKTRRRIFGWYQERLNGIPGIGLQPVCHWATPAPWLFCITVAADHYGHDRNHLMTHLADKGIETRPFFRPLHEMPPFCDQGRKVELPVTVAVSKAGVCLPCYTTLGESSVDRITEIIKAYHS
ncbi:MAG TPA: DegT/DnrJ/EryC1/StrS family aminotransferase [Rhodospirillaceae bacterium]|nr:DegT/DnrJ/EryC1/StrS family aminotransferase [Rhodospirillaceae bacterium]